MVLIRVFIEGGLGPFTLQRDTVKAAVDTTYEMMWRGFWRDSTPPVGEVTCYPPYKVQRIELQPMNGELIPTGF